MSVYSCILDIWRNVENLFAFGLWRGSNAEDLVAKIALIATISKLHWLHLVTFLHCLCYQLCPLKRMHSHIRSGSNVEDLVAKIALIATIPN